MKNSFLSWVLISKKRCKVSLTHKNNHKYKHILTCKPFCGLWVPSIIQWGHRWRHGCNDQLGGNFYFCMILGTICDVNMSGRHCDIFYLWFMFASMFPKLMA